MNRHISGGYHLNRENKRKKYEKGYYQNHPCNDSFTCKCCGRLVTPEAARSEEHTSELQSLSC